MTVDNTEFKVGDTVWCVAYGKGKVVHVNETGAYPVKVQFVDLNSDYYTYEGKLRKKGSRTLFFNEPTVEGKTTRPFVSTLIDKEIAIEYKTSGVSFVGKCVSETEEHVCLASDAIGTKVCHYKPDINIYTIFYKVNKE